MSGARRTDIRENKRRRESSEALLERSGFEIEYIDVLMAFWVGVASTLSDARLREMEALRASGKVRAIGVSNFNEGEIKDLVDNTGELPEVNQIQYHPWSSPAWHAAVAAWAGQGVVVTAYNSLGGARFATSGLTGSAVSSIAQERGVSVNSVLLAWARSKGCAVIPGSSTPAHIAENLQTLEQLTPSEVSRIDASAAPDGWWSPRGPNKYGDEDARTPWRDAAPAKKRRRHHRMEH